MGSENGIQKLNRELRELAMNARREREEFREFTSRHQGRRRRPIYGSVANDEPVGRSQDD